MNKKRGREEWDCLHIAARNGQYAICKLLLDRGADPKVEDCNGETPFFHAAAAGHLSVCKLLAQCSPRDAVWNPNHKFWTPLHLARRSGGGVLRRMRVVVQGTR